MGVGGKGERKTAAAKHMTSTFAKRKRGPYARALGSTSRPTLSNTAAADICAARTWQVVVAVKVNYVAPSTLGDQGNNLNRGSRVGSERERGSIGMTACSWSTCRRGSWMWWEVLGCLVSLVARGSGSMS